MGSEHATPTNCRTKRGREPVTVYGQQKLHMSINNNVCQDEPGGLIGSILNPNPVSTGLRLSYEEDERNSSVTSAGENLKAALPGMLSLSNGVGVDVDLPKAEFDNYIRVQEENITKGLRDLNQRHTASLLNALENGVSRKLCEKELEIENMNHKNKELGEKIKKVAMDAQSWHYRAKYNESLVIALKGNLQQVIAQGAVHAREGWGDSELDDAASYTNHQGFAGGSGNVVSTKRQLNCKACKVKEVSFLLFPCRHLCLCKECEGFIDVCPVCQAMKTASVQVYMS
ncbi:unnamed protein product [Ilex paraguariensis]